MRTIQLKSINLNLLSGLIILAIFTSCKKDWLDAKPSKSLITPNSVEDYQAILDNSGIMNSYYPNLGEVAADNYSVSYQDWQAGIKPERNAYIWELNDFYDSRFSEWELAYKRILYANLVIKGINDVARNSANQQRWDQVKGSALFYRSMEFYNLAQQFSRPYDKTTAGSDIGFYMPLTPDVTAKQVKVTVKQIHDQIFNDLKEATRLLPDKQNYRTRPSKAAAFGLLARAYLSVEDYDQAFLYADSCLAISKTLLNYNNLDLNTTYKVPVMNDEIIFQASISTYTLLELTRKVVDNVLYESYDNNDLRKKVFFYDFSGKKIFTGSYLNVAYNVFGGIAADEIYLIRAECMARKGNAAAALKDLNDLLRNRWVANKFKEVTANSDEEALRLVLQERRKELIFRNLRWTDLRRLNKDPRFSVTLTRTLNNKVYTLPPNSEGYTFPLPPEH